MRQATNHTPFWLMRQSGRYLPEYCATRVKAGSFMGLATNVDFATEVMMVFDSWGGVLADGAFQKFSLAYTRRVLDQLIRSHEGHTIPRLVFTKGGGLWLEDMNRLDCDVLGLDWTVNLAKARQVVGGFAGQAGKALQDNLDPNVLFAHASAIEQEVRKVLDSFRTPHTDPNSSGPTHIFNLGHGISQFTPPDHVAVVVDAVHSYSRAQRKH